MFIFSLHENSMITDKSTAEQITYSKPTTSSAPCSPFLPRSQKTTSGTSAEIPLKSHCCFLSSSCRSCISTDISHSCFQNISPISVDNNNQNSNGNILQKNLSLANERYEYSSDAESESGSTIKGSSNDSSYSSTSLDYQKSESNSKSIKESDIKYLLEEINNIVQEDSRSGSNSTTSQTTGNDIFQDTCYSFIEPQIFPSRESGTESLTESESCKSFPLIDILRELDDRFIKYSALE